MNDIFTVQHSETGNCATYLSCLKALNEAVLGWIEQHVKSNPMVILSPVFEDYNRHLAEIEQKYHQTKCTHPRYNSPVSKGIGVSSNDRNSSITSSSPAVANKNSALNSGDLFKIPNVASQPTVASNFAFNSTPANGIPFTFGSTNKQQPTDANKADLTNSRQDKQIKSLSGPILTTNSLSTDTKLTSGAATIASSAQPLFQFGTNLATGSGAFQFNTGASQTTSSSLIAPKLTAPTTTAAPLFTFSSTQSSTISSTTSTGFVFGTANASTATNTTAATTKPIFSFGLQSSASAIASTSAPASGTTTQPSFTFGSTSSGFSAKPPVFGSIFGTSTNGNATGAAPTSQVSGLPLFGSFGGTQSGSAALALAPVQQAEGTTDANEDGDEEEEPPKLEKVQHNEEGAVYSAENVRLYFRGNDSKFASKGAGSLFLKPVQANSGSRTQLIIRANNTLGTVLLSVLLSDSMRFQKITERNAVTFVCVPNPPIASLESGKPAGLLIRTESAQDCDALFMQLETLKMAK